MLHQGINFVAGASPRLRGKLAAGRGGSGFLRCIPAPAGETFSFPRPLRAGGVHPRACGGNMARRSISRAVQGASPRLRGKRETDGPHPHRGGCIPAPAGETGRSLPVAAVQGVHPRACGGNGEGSPLVLLVLGASPRLRGKPSRSGEDGSGWGCIPAPAGETGEFSEPPPLDRVHPRACGGNVDRPPRPGCLSGASPRLRGKPLLPVALLPVARCIPAPAGETRLERGSGRLQPVHPRACGGNRRTVRRRLIRWGASPRLRGKRRRGGRSPAPRGCIPAPAGETSRSRGTAGGGAVHPRACGGNRGAALDRAGRSGASPRLRGKHIRDGLQQPGRGCIPAPAGETCLLVPLGGGVGVHPRACGGNVLVRRLVVGASGASPRLRGKPRAAATHGAQCWCIPAPAGETDRGERRQSKREVHPRACGGNGGCPRHWGRLRGASPRLRGKPSETTGSATRGRCIPAPAGETRLAEVHGRARRVHPRACGGNFAVRVTVAATRGASPRLRGKRFESVPGIGEVGCIPAPAGETSTPLPTHHVVSVHPRACGGNNFTETNGLHGRGASPRLRGKRGAANRDQCVPGCIPAPAGETVPARWRIRPSSVHPRACGGNSVRRMMSIRFSGASPRLRGKPAKTQPRPWPVWCIPAPAGETFGAPRAPDSARVHPRACGGNLRRRPWLWPRLGASPRLRGKPTGGIPLVALPGCIPAPAGETSPSLRILLQREVHPRACGGNAHLDRAALRRDGASPRLRGKPSWCGLRTRHTRCIPAPAGETVASVHQQRHAGVHPRACGGNGSGRAHRCRRRGASPRLRGKRYAGRDVPVLPGCIPAPAGETPAAGRRSRRRGVHPRACGGNAIHMSVRGATWGASPRLRGKRRATGPRRGCSRCIPAPAGETAASPVALPNPGVHPRACGGNRSPPFSTLCLFGASPRLRGKQGRGVILLADDRCIPAPAGETAAGGATACSFTVHPRACGGNRIRQTDKWANRGASPRLRGKHAPAAVPAVPLRCIPAPAGETTRTPGRPGSAPVHPRACGGNGEVHPLPSDRRGASPRLRGKLLVIAGLEKTHRCIPAPAGETRAGSPRSDPDRVHPRACGGNPAPSEGSRRTPGASPRLRGKLRGQRPLHRGGRCIPAPAGETRAASARLATTSVHPRACGGNLSPCAPRWRGRGASPRLRGKPRRVRSTRSGRTVHPRACGGNMNMSLIGMSMNGASPRLRGKRTRPTPERAAQGCIPAPAGETAAGPPDPRREGVHPRACGGNRPSTPLAGLDDGASPRLRGKPGRSSEDRQDHRCIPAPAGETRRALERGRVGRVHPRACGGNATGSSASGCGVGASPRLRGKRPRVEHQRPLQGVHPRACGGNPSCHNCHIFVTVHPSSPGSQPPSPRRGLQRFPPNHIDAVVLHDLLRRLPQRANRLPLSRGRSRPSHDDRTLPVVGPPIRQHGPDSLPNRRGHVGLRVHARRDLQHA